MAVSPIEDIITNMVNQALVEWQRIMLKRINMLEDRVSALEPKPSDHAQIQEDFIKRTKEHAREELINEMLDVIEAQIKAARVKSRATDFIMHEFSNTSLSVVQRFIVSFRSKS